ncbi:MAG TPA: glycosyltransferase, partial [Bdellovibrionales bacterium]|nr:glycosyltransferase [Bdellovibrionales bacterium]
MKLSVIYSFYNEEENLPELIRRTRLAMRNIGLDNRGYEIVFVNDVSKDRSVEIITEHMEQGKDIKLVNTTRTFGNAACILAGFAFSTGEHIAFLDADLQDPPEVVGELIGRWK